MKKHKKRINIIRRILIVFVPPIIIFSYVVAISAYSIRLAPFNSLIPVESTNNTASTAPTLKGTFLKDFLGDTLNIPFSKLDYSILLENNNKLSIKLGEININPLILPMPEEQKSLLGGISLHFVSSDGIGKDMAANVGSTTYMTLRGVDISSIKIGANYKILSLANIKQGVGDSAVSLGTSTISINPRETKIYIYISPSNLIKIFLIIFAGWGALILFAKGIFEFIFEGFKRTESTTVRRAIKRKTKARIKMNNSGKL